MIAFDRAPPAPKALLLLATFNGSQRRIVDAFPDLRQEILAADPADWAQILADFTARRLVAKPARAQLESDDENGMRRQAEHDLRSAADALSTLRDERRTELFRSAARLAKYIAHGILTADEARAVLIDASVANGAIAAYGRVWAEQCVGRAFALGRADPLPPLARRFVRGGAE
ncbi:MAG: hypothetical protein ACOYLQ_10070 [Hyphomicrobiaceae bacterium]